MNRLTHILHLDASARGSSSHSRQISGEFIQAWLQAHPGDAVTHHDRGHQAIPRVSEEFIGPMYTPAESRRPAPIEALKLSDELIGEIKTTDIYVFGVPMYNFGVPSMFKACIDHVVRAGGSYNIQEPTVRTAFGLAGVTDQTLIQVNNTARGGETEALLATACEQIKTLAGA